MLKNNPVLMNGRFIIGQTFASLKYRNYRLWFLGQTISLFGSWMQMTALGFLVFQLTNSPAYLGYTSFASGIPAWIFTLYAGVVADRISRRSLMVITQSCMMILAFILAILTYLKLVQPWHIMILSFCFGTANSFDSPARLAFVRELVDRDDMTNAIALNSAMFNTAMFVGPAAAGIIYALLGPFWCFTFNGISFIAVIFALLLMRINSQPAGQKRNSAMKDMGEGLHYVISHSLIRILICVAGTVSLFIMSFVTLFPAWAVNIMGGDARTNGFLQSARGFGALVGSLTIASLSRYQYKGKLLTLGTFAAPIFLFVFTLVRWMPVSLFILVIVGISSIFIMNMANALVQNIVSDSLRGRVMSVYSLIFMGSMPLGSLWIGTVAEKISEPVAIIISASVAFVIAILIWILVPKIRFLK